MKSDRKQLMDPQPTAALASPYRGRLAPSPTGHLHSGHAATFLAAARRAADAGGTLILRIEDIDRARCRPEFVASQIADLAWLGIRWQEGPDVGGPHAPYLQSQRMAFYRRAFDKLHAAGYLYPCTCSRRDIAESQSAPHEQERTRNPGSASDSEPIYPGTCRDKLLKDIPPDTDVAWRFRVPDGRTLAFEDTCAGPQAFVAGRDFGDFPVWRKDGWPSYQLACVTDDIAMQITEVVRGRDLLLSTARQLLLYEALGAVPPSFHHTPLVLDQHGRRLAKRNSSSALRNSAPLNKNS